MDNHETPFCPLSISALREAEACREAILVFSEFLRNESRLRPADGGEVALGVHLRFFTLGRGRQRHDAKNPRPHPFGDSLDHPALAGAVAPLKHDADLPSFLDGPLLQFDQFHVQAGQFAFVVLTIQFDLGSGYFLIFSYFCPQFVLSFSEYLKIITPPPASKIHGRP